MYYSILRASRLSGTILVSQLSTCAKVQTSRTTINDIDVLGNLSCTEGFPEQTNLCHRQCGLWSPSVSSAFWFPLVSQWLTTDCPQRMVLLCSAICDISATVRGEPAFLVLSALSCRAGSRSIRYPCLVVQIPILGLPSILYKREPCFATFSILPAELNRIRR